MKRELLVELGIVGIIALVIFILFIEIFAILLIASAIASFFGFSGILWWIVVIGLFVIINGIIGFILKK